MTEQLQFVIGVLLHALVKAAPYLVAGFVLAAILREFVPTKTINAWFGGRGVAPLLRATGVGTLLPICSCGVIPLGIGAFRAGAARGTALAFMAATPLISPLSVLLAWSLLGAQLTLALMAAALLGALAIGLVDNYFRGGNTADGSETVEHDHHAGDDAAHACDDHDHHHDHEHVGTGSWAQRTGRALRWGLTDFGPQVSVDMFLGLCVAAIMLAIVPPDKLSHWVGGGSLVSLLAVVLVALPLYTCTLPTIPVVKGLLLLGMGSGAGVALLVAGPATNLGEINAMRRQMGMRTALFFAVSLIVIGVAAGAAVDQLIALNPNTDSQAAGVLDASVISEVAHHGGIAHLIEEVAPWQWPCLAIIAAVLLLGIYQRLAKLPTKFRSKPSVSRWLFGRV
ncbi:MAG: permease [Pirellulales bacterium]|nr:permease [Pirellulales bacterium]